MLGSCFVTLSLFNVNPRNSVQRQQGTRVVADPSQSAVDLSCCYHQFILSSVLISHSPFIIPKGQSTLWLKWKSYICDMLREAEGLRDLDENYEKFMCALRAPATGCSFGFGGIESVIKCGINWGSLFEDWGNIWLVRQRED